MCGWAIEGARCGPRPNASPPVHPGRKNPALISSSLHLGQRCSALVPDGQTTKTRPQITPIFSASTSISVPDARERTFATAFIATSKFGLLMRQPECLLAKPARGACEPGHKLGKFRSGRIILSGENVVASHAGRRPSRDRRFSCLPLRTT